MSLTVRFSQHTPLTINTNDLNPTIFLEFDKHILLFKRNHQQEQTSHWELPRGKVEEGKVIELLPSNLESMERLYGRVHDRENRPNLYHTDLKEQPLVVNNSLVYSKYEWVSIYAVKLMPLIEAQIEAFDLVYRNRIWQRADLQSPTIQKIQTITGYVLSKGDKTLIFNADRRFILNLIGNVGSGKGTQADLLNKLFGSTHISIGDIYRDEHKKDTQLGKMVFDYRSKYVNSYFPDEVPIGMMAKRLALQDCSQAFILDGFPRTEVQSNIYSKVLLRKNDFHLPIFMHLPEIDIFDRITRRFICGNCNYQVREHEVNPFPGYCPVDAQKGKMVELQSRDADRQKNENRIRTFNENRDGILRSLSQRDAVKTFSLNRSIPPPEVLHLICDHIQGRLDSLHLQESVSNSLAKKAVGPEIHHLKKVGIMLFCGLITSFIAGSILRTHWTKK